METIWAEAIPNWITALATVAAVGLTAYGARTAWKSLQAELHRDADDRARAQMARARSVTAEWVLRHRDGSGVGGQAKEWGLLVTNHNPTPVYGVSIAATVHGDSTPIPIIDPLVNELFIRRDLRGDEVRWSVRRVGADTVKMEPILDRAWRLAGIGFVLDGEALSWHASSVLEPDA